MSKELKLQIEAEVLRKAEAYAERSGRSLSDLVEHYLKAIAIGESKTDEEKQYTAITQSLYGVLSEFYAEDFDYKKVLEEELQKKYL